MRLFIFINIMTLVLSSLALLHVSTDNIPLTNTLLIEELAGVMS